MSTKQATASEPRRLESTIKLRFWEVRLYTSSRVKERLQR